jgi:predicted RNA-binding Zn ribbon-like protein
MPATSNRWSRFAVSLAEATAGQPLCVSLCNTRHWRNSAAPKEVLTGYDELVKWAVAKGVYTADEGETLVREAAAHPHVANAELRRTIQLREAIAAVLAAHAHAVAADPAALAEVEGTFREALAQLALRVEDGRLVPSLPPAREGLEVPRWQAALSAVSLLASPALARVKQCADDRGCGWLFVDTTRNGSRQFCFSRECGNRARQARFRARHRGHDQPAG